MTDLDPSIDLRLPSRSAAEFRPLEDDEVDLARAVAVGGSVRAAAAWALCEATARTGELAAVRRDDIDLDQRRAWIQGTPRTEARWGQLTDWGVAQVSRQLELVDDAVDAP